MYAHDLIILKEDSMENRRTYEDWINNDYFDEAGTDIAGMSDDELLEQSEVFSLPSGRFLIVEG